MIYKLLVPQSLFLPYLFVDFKISVDYELPSALAHHMRVRHPDHLPRHLVVSDGGAVLDVSGQVVPASCEDFLDLLLDCLSRAAHFDISLNVYNFQMLR